MKTRSLSVSFLVALGMILALPATAQLADDCTGADLTGADTLPFSDTVGTAGFSQALDMSAGTCTELGPAGMDNIVCFTPENACNVDFTCDYIPSGTTMAANLYEGACSAAPAACAATAQADGPATISNFALSAGTNYCFQCESAVAIVQMVADITAVSGDCGSLPVQLQEFTISE